MAAIEAKLAAIQGRVYRAVGGLLFWARKKATRYFFHSQLFVFEVVEEDLSTNI